jgi:hypothetical protein
MLCRRLNRRKYSCVEYVACGISDSDFFTDKQILPGFTKSVTYPQMCGSVHLCRRYLKCREALMASADLYVVGRSMRNLISLPAFITPKLSLL